MYAHHSQPGPNGRHSLCSGTIVEMVAENMSRQEILQAYPDLEPDDIRQALNYAAEA